MAVAFFNISFSVLSGKTELVYTDEFGNETRELLHDFTDAGIIQGQHNTKKSIESFARSCFNYALDVRQDLTERK